MWLVGDVLIVDEKGIEIQRSIRTYKKVLRHILSKFVLTVLNPIPQPAVFIRFDAVRAVGDFDAALKYTMDYEYWLRLYERFGAPIFVSTPLALFRIHRTSKGSTQYTKQFREGYAIARRYTDSRLALALHPFHS